MKFESARVCVQRRDPNPSANAHNEEPEFHYEVVAWPPGTVDGGLLPQIGDHLSLPGYETPFRVVNRAIHWPAPSSPEASRGEVVVDLVVEPQSAPWTASRPGRPGEDLIRTEGRWLAARVASYETRTSFGGTPYTRVDLALPGVGTLSRRVTYNWQAVEMFPGWADFQNVPSQGLVNQGELTHCLRIGQEFEVRIAPSQLPSENGRLEIWEVRPPRQLEPGEEPNTWDQQALELSAELWGEQ